MGCQMAYALGLLLGCQTMLGLLKSIAKPLHLPDTGRDEALHTGQQEKKRTNSRPQSEKNSEKTH